MFWYLMGIAGVMLIALIYLIIKNKSKERIEVVFSEYVGGKIIDHKSTYEAILEPDINTMKIPKIKLSRPIPPREFQTPTKNGLNRIYLVKIDNHRFGYRIPSLHNQIFTYERDEEGNIIKHDGLPNIIKKPWQYCDNVVEPDASQWEEANLIQLQERRKAKADFWDKWGAPISMAMIFLFAVITLQMTTKQLTADKAAIMEKAEKAQENADLTQQNLNNLIQKVTGQRVFDNEESDREKYYNNTNS